MQVKRIRACLESKQDCTAILLNYRSDGSTFLNRIELTHLMDKDGQTPFIVGLQCKVRELMMIMLDNSDVNDCDDDNYDGVEDNDDE